MVKKILNGILVGVLIVFTVAVWSVVYHKVRAIQFNDALAEHELALEESNEMRIKHTAELQELSMIVLAGATLSEKILVQLCLAHMATARQGMDEKLAKTKQKVCDLVDEKEPFCQEKRKPAPQSWSI